MDAGDPSMVPAPVQANQTVKVEVVPLPRLPAPSLSVKEVLPVLQPLQPLLASVSDARSLSSSGRMMKSTVSDLSKEDQAAQEPSEMLPGGSQTFDFSGPLQVEALLASGPSPSKQTKGQKKSARLVGPGRGSQESHQDEDLTLSGREVLEASNSTLRLPILTKKEADDAAATSGAEPLEPQQGTLPMQISSTLQAEGLGRLGLTGASEPLRKKRWKRERMRALMVTSQSISGVPAMEWILPVVADASVRQIQKFNSPADIGARLKSRNLHGRSRKSAASIPISKGTFFPALC